MLSGELEEERGVTVRSGQDGLPEEVTGKRRLAGLDSGQQTVRAEGEAGWLIKDLILGFLP